MSSAVRLHCVHRNISKRRRGVLYEIWHAQFEHIRWGNGHRLRRILLGLGDASLPECEQPCGMDAAYGALSAKDAHTIPSFNVFHLRCSRNFKMQIHIFDTCCYVVYTCVRSVAISRRTRLDEPYMSGYLCNLTPSVIARWYVLFRCVHICAFRSHFASKARTFCCVISYV